MEGETPQQQAGGVGELHPFSSIIPLLASLPGAAECSGNTEAKPSRYPVAKGLLTLPMEKVWNLEYVEMEEFLPAPRALQLAEQGRPSPSLQESLVGAFSQF